MNAAKKETITKLCIAAIMMAMVALCIVNPNEEAGCDCITSGQVVIIEDSIPPLAATISKTTIKTSVKKSTKIKKLKKPAQKSKTVTAKSTKKTTANKTSGNDTIKTDTTVLTTTKTITKKKSKKQTIKKTVETTVKTTTTTQTTTATGGEVKIQDIAPKTDPEVMAAFVDGGYKIIVNPAVSYSGVFRSASKMIELKRASTVAYHEIGHFVSYRTGRADRTPEFKDIYNAEKDKYTASNKAYVTQSSGEYFAESFKNYTENPEKLKADRPQTYAYVKEKVAQF